MTERRVPPIASKSSSTAAAPRRVALIGVHGVAHHDPGETANAMADLLLSLPPYNPKADTSCEKRPPSEFEYFDSKGLQIPLQPVCVDKEKRVQVERNQNVPSAFRLQEGSYKFALHLAEKAKKNETLKDRGEIGRQWSVKLLQDYYGAGDGNKYVTTRLEGKRATDSTEVHIYEMFWADLAHPTNSILSFLLALFQFILHVPSLSRLAIDTRPNPDRIWRVFQALHRYAVRILQMALPLAKIVLLIALSAAIPAVTTVKQLDALSAVVAGVIAVALPFLAMNYWVRPVFRSRLVWLLASFLLAIVASVTTYYAVHQHHTALEMGQFGNSADVIVLATALWVLGAGLMWWALDAYQDTRPGISGWGWTTYFLALLGFAIASYYARSQGGYAGEWIPRASYWTVQWTLAALRLSWIALALLAILSTILGAIAWRRAGRGATSEIERTDARGRARAAVRTSRFALAMPSFLFVLVTSLIWAALFSIERKIQDPFFHANVIEHDALPVHSPFGNNFDLFPNHFYVLDHFVSNCDPPKPTCSGPKGDTCSCSTPTKADYLEGVLAWSVGSGSYLVVLVTLAGLIILIWWALPSVLTEKFPPRRDHGWYAKHGTEPPRNSTNHEAMWMGAWISRGLDSISLVTWFSWSAIFLIPLAFIYLGPPWHLAPLAAFRLHSDEVTKLVVSRVIAVASTTAILATFVHYSSPVLRVILDVDTYMRTGPIEGTPRAKIFERYVSLLRHIAQYRGPDGRGYDRVVIVAHSLGALISGDLLNLLQHQKNDPALQSLGYWHDQKEPKIPVHLFTMGNPVRQLLNRFFPYLYDWVRSDPDNGSKTLRAPQQESSTRLDARLPDPGDLGVEKWVSAYRSGDYVGRSLWLDEWYRRTDKGDNEGIYPEELEKIFDREDNPIRVEFCIGAGAHTHYWDDSAPDIAKQLDELISAWY